MSDSCPNGGCPGWVEPGPCGIGGYSVLPTLQLETADGRRIAIGRLATRLSRDWARANRLGDDSQFWDAQWQMSLEPRGERWVALPNPAAANESLADGATLTSERDLSDGLVLGVGRASKGIVKTPLIVRLQGGPSTT